MTLLFRVFWFCVLAVALGATPALADRRVALVVGNSSYKNINRLTNPTNDAPDMAAALQKLGFEVILRTNLEKGSFDRALSEFARRSAGADAALFYYAGHGIQYQRQNYLLPVDIEIEDYADVEFQSVSINRVLDALRRSDGVKIVILDACRDNPLDRKVSNRGLERVPGLAPLDRTDGLVIAYATASDQVAQDGMGRNSPFTESLVRRMVEPGLEIATVFRRVSQDVYDQTKGAQRPEISISLVRDFYLNAADSDSAVWAKIRSSFDVQDFVDFQRRYPGSPFLLEAQARVDFIQNVRRQAEAESVARDRAATAERERQAALERERVASLERERVAAEDRERLAAQERDRAAAAERERVQALVRERAAAQERERVAALERERVTAERERQAAAERDRVATARREVERLASLNAGKGEAAAPGMRPEDASREPAERRRQREAYEQRQKRREALLVVRARALAAGADVSGIDIEIRDMDRLDVEWLARLRKEAAASTLR